MRYEPLTRYNGKADSINLIEVVVVFYYPFAVLYSNQYWCWESTGQAQK